MNGHIYRTLKQAEMLRDYSNHTLKFNRSMHDAGMNGHIDESPGPQTLGALLLWGCVGALVLWVFLAVVLA